MTSLEIGFLLFFLPIVWKKRINLNSGVNRECFKNILDVFRRVYSMSLADGANLGEHSGIFSGVVAAVEISALRSKWDTLHFMLCGVVVETHASIQKVFVEVTPIV